MDRFVLGLLGPGRRARPGAPVPGAFCIWGPCPAAPD